MAEQWTPLPLDRPLFANLTEDAVSGFMTAVENGYQNELGQHTRFPGMEQFTLVDANAKRLYLHDFNNDLIAVSDKGQVYRIDFSGNVSNVTAVPVAGGRRVVFAKTDRDLLMAAGGSIVRLRDRLTEVLSDDAPRASHVGWLDNFTIAVEINSGRFYHSRPGEPDVWDVIDTFSADGSPDNINSMLVTPFRELMLGGAQSTEQFERSASGDVPFYRRWAIGEGIKLPYGMLHADNAMWAINSLTEWVRASGQVSSTVSEPIGRLLESIDSWTDAWIGGYPDKPLHILGQRFMILQAPEASNIYGTKGVTIFYYYRGKKFFQLYGWDSEKGVPRRWRGWSHWTLWDKVFVGGDDGYVYRLTSDTYRNGDELQRWLIRTSHQAIGTAALIKAFRLHIVRGIGGTTTAPTIRVRCSRDGRAFGPWISRSLGNAGDRARMIEFGGFGIANTFRFEISSSEDCAIDLIAAEVKAESVGH